MVAQKDIALKLGISRTAVSAILSGGPNAEKFRPAMRRKVLKAAEELGYQHNALARAIRTGKNNVIGFITQGLQNEYTGRLLKGIVELTSQKDFFVKIIPIEQERDASMLAKQCIGQCLAGVIIYDIAEPEFLSIPHDMLKKHRIPLVIAGGSPDVGQCLRISSDTLQGGRIAFEYLYSLGHRTFALPSDYSWAAYSQNLLKGFADAAEDAGIQLADQALWRDPDKTNIDSLCDRLVGKMPSACFCNTDFLALQVITGLQKRNIRVPEDISVMGRGNLKFCMSCCPEITSIDENLSEIGQRATTLLLEHIDGNDTVPYLEYFPHKLVIRNSTASAPAEKGI